MVCTEARRTSIVRVLLADDDGRYVEALKAILLAHDWIEVVGTARDGAEAVERALELRPDVVLMDGLMPRLDGYQATRRLREAGSGARVVIVTSSRDPEDAARAHAAGAAALLRKGEAEASLPEAVRDLAPLPACEPEGIAAQAARRLADASGGVGAVYLAAPDVGVSLAALAGAADRKRLAAPPGIVVRTFRSGVPVRAGSAELERLAETGVPAADALAAPLIHEGETLGAVFAAAPPGGPARVDPELVSAVAGLAASAAAAERRVALTHAEARRDALTGLPNRRAFDECLAAADGIAVALIDVDDFKDVNERQGHAGGDDVLRQIARIAQRAVRASEEVYRLGGDELAVLAPATSAQMARLAERIRTSVLRQRRNGLLPTVSAGVAAFPGDAGSKEELLSHADAALYEAKRGGKNKVVEHAASRGGGGSAQGTPAYRPSPARRPRVLIVDDDQQLRELLRTTLGFLDVEVDEGATGAEAVASIAARRPDVIVLDVGLPDRDGLTICRELKDDPATENVQIIVLTGADAGAEAQTAGADAFLRKPFSPLELLAVVERLAGSAADRPLRVAERSGGRDQLLLYAEDLGRLLDVELGQRELLQRAYRETVTALAVALESKDIGTGAHSQRVQRYATELAWALSPGLLDDPGAEYGFLLHDVGKIGIPDGILRKPGALTPGEWRLLQNHTILGEQMLGGVALLQGEGLRIVRSHHERWDGNGYPDGLAGSDIPMGARIFAVADALDAMTTDRPYRSARSWDEAAEEIARESGRQFDPDVAGVFLESEERLRAIHMELVRR